MKKKVFKFLLDRWNQPACYYDLMRLGSQASLNDALIELIERNIIEEIVQYGMIYLQLTGNDLRAY